jgi:hypothetical protein
VLDHQPPKRPRAYLDEVGDDFVRLGEAGDGVGQVLERALRERVDQEAILRAEEAVDGARRGAGLLGGGADRERRRPALGDEPLRRRAERGARLLVVLPRPPHGLTQYRNVLRYV